MALRVKYTTYHFSSFLNSTNGVTLTQMFVHGLCDVNFQGVCWNYYFVDLLHWCGFINLYWEEIMVIYWFWKWFFDYIAFISMQCLWNWQYQYQIQVQNCFWHNLCHIHDFCLYFNKHRNLKEQRLCFRAVWEWYQYWLYQYLWSWRFYSWLLQW